MAGYTPGEQPKPGERVIKLNTNENPFPPSPRVVDAIRRITPDALRRYPSSMADEFRAVAARVHGVSPENILAGNGSDDILQIALRSYCGPGDVLACPDPTYSLYPVLAELADVRLIPVPWEPGWRLPIEALLGERARAIFFANPNSPSGTSVAVADIEALARATEALVLVDEAYADFADDNCLSLPGQQPNVLVTRTFSKGYGLAGLRFGYAIGDPAVIAQMAKVKDSYNCDAIAIAAACAALDDAGVRARELAGHSSRTRETLLELERRRLRGHPQPGEFPAGDHAGCGTCADGSTPPSRRAACSSGFSTSRRWTTSCGSASAPPRRTTRCLPRSMQPLLRAAPWSLRPFRERLRTD